MAEKLPELEAGPMTTLSTNGKGRDVPAQIFEEFLKALEADGASPELITRLRKTLLENKTFTDRALKAAVFGEEFPL